MSEATDLITNLHFHQSWITICQEYLSTDPTLPFDRFLRRMLDVEKESMEMVAKALRLAGHPPGRVSGNDETVTEARRRRTQSTRLQFIQVGLDRSVVWYQVRLATPDDPHLDLWQPLYDRHAMLLAEINDLLGTVPTT